MKTEKLTIKEKKLAKWFKPWINFIAWIYKPWAVIEEEQKFSNYGNELNRQYHQKFLKLLK